MLGTRTRLNEQCVIFSAMRLLIWFTWGWSDWWWFEYLWNSQVQRVDRLFELNAYRIRAWIRAALKPLAFGIVSHKFLPLTWLESFCIYQLVPSLVMSKKFCWRDNRAAIEMFTNENVSSTTSENLFEFEVRDNPSDFSMIYWCGFFFSWISV